MVAEHLVQNTALRATIAKEKILRENLPSDCMNMDEAECQIHPDRREVYLYRGKEFLTIFPIEFFTVWENDQPKDGFHFPYQTVKHG